ncbi:phospholipase D-like domain-containing protein [Ferruginibacter albus]|uniref:phospholipase D-like domain-containing protein n=1 Tax=Ferruginibacter albus TaxID=2875540 RepID=UPI001CC80236|nr:phospholipase D-like domain-containing protein [Ferruginibacter albus]UAY53266.1 hypothetical protein K9M53_06235 [Ferruginibacter albus]
MTTKKGAPGIICYSNNAETLIAWEYPAKIKNCVGFALFRKKNDETDASAEPVYTSVGFDGDSAKTDEWRPSTEWPIQKFVWTDFFVKLNDTVCYKVIPMIWDGTTLIKDIKNSSAWSNRVKVNISKDCCAYFNVGIIGSQAISRRMQQLNKGDLKKKLDDVLNEEDSDIRKFLGGEMVQKAYDLLDGVYKNKQVIYCCLYELDEPGLIRRLCKIGSRANVILSNGSYKSNNKDPNKPARKQLKDAGVKVVDRILTQGLGHHKFLLIGDKGAKPTDPPDLQFVWTGSMNWTMHGLFTQVNNSVLLKNAEVAGWYYNQWKKIAAVEQSIINKEETSHFPKAFKESNSTAVEDDKIKIKTWFAPVINKVDLEDAKQLITKAKTGILFLMFKPGNDSTLYNFIAQTSRARKSLFVHGMLNAEMGGKDSPLTFFHRGKPQVVNISTVLPDKNDKDLKYWMKEIGVLHGSVKIHSKIILIDPFSDNCILMTGSHNMGPNASTSNDDNLNIITGHKDLCMQYAVNIITVYNHFRSRFYIKRLGLDWEGNHKDDKWMGSYMTGPKKDEIKFWMQEK